MFIPSVAHSIKYNPAFDGLRGIAVLLVLLFHIWPNYFSFGYIGVDVFFVLSGYLITNIINTKAARDNFYFVEFYRNRIRRIFPSMLLVLITTAFVGWLLLFASEYQELGNHLTSSAFFYQNFRLIDEAGYWDEAAQYKPLLHFWSLSIEEQFYIFWPLIIFFIVKVRFNLFYSLALIFTGLLAIAALSDIDGFYHSFTRFWELSFGGLIYSATLKFENADFIQRFKTTIFILFVCSFSLAYESQSFDLFRASVLVILSGLFIWSLTLDRNNKIMTFSPLVLLGLISFPLYLWHYVLLSFVHILNIESSNYEFGLLFLSVSLAFITYKYIEVPFRRQSSLLVSLLLVSLTVGVAMYGKYVLKNEGLPARAHLNFSKAFEEQYVKPIGKNAEGVSLSTDLLGYISKQDFVKSTSFSYSDRLILLAGDSHAYVNYAGLSEVLKAQGYDTLLMASNSCPPFIDSEKAIGVTLIAAEKCKTSIDELYSFFEKKLFKAVVFSVRGPKYITKKGYGIIDNELRIKDLKLLSEYKNVSHSTSHEELFYKNIEDTFKFFDDLDVEFYFILENPELGFSPKTCMTRPFNIVTNIVTTKCRIDYSVYLARMNKYKKIIISMADKYSNIKVLDPGGVFCDGKYCYAVIDNKMLYADDDHLSIEGSRIQAEYFLEKMFLKKQQ